MFRLFLFVLLGLATFRLAFAEPQIQEEPKIPVTPLPLMIQCTDAEVVERMVEDYNEQPFIEGLGTWEIPSGQTVGGRIEIYANPKSGTYTIVIAMSEDLKCVVISGTDIKPWLSGKNAI